MTYRPSQQPSSAKDKEYYKFSKDGYDVGVQGPPLLITKNLRKYFGGRRFTSYGRSVVKAVDDVSFAVAKGETLGIVGESGCGKSTLARLLMHLIVPEAGTIILDGLEVGAVRGVSVKDVRRQMQIVFQDSYASLNPRLTIEDTIAFGLVCRGLSRNESRLRLQNVLRLVGLAPEEFAQRYPHELSGGQRQRVNIARALALEPQVLILDEAVSALDKSIEAQILSVLQDLKEKLALTYVFISHDLSVIHYISDRILVMYLGKVVEVGQVDRIYSNAMHPYTRALLASRPSMDPRKRRTTPPLTGDPPSPIDPPTGCRFRTRCEMAERICAVTEPVLFAPINTERHAAACHAVIPGSGHSRAPARPARS